MRRLLVFQHVAFELLGTLNPLLKAHGFRIRYVNFERDPHARPQIEKYDGLVVLGGSMNVDEVEAYPNLAAEVDMIQEAVAAGMPVLGICLGAQLVAKALGGSVSPNPESEVGWYEVRPTHSAQADALLKWLRPAETIFQWHTDTFTLPHGCELLATSRLCQHQAFRYGDNVYGFQFHLEADANLIERWLTVDANQTTVEQMGGNRFAQKVRLENERYLKRQYQLAQEVFQSFAGLFSISPKRRALPSR